MRLNELFNGWKDDLGIFNFLVFGEWNAASSDHKKLNALYHGLRSGRKTVPESVIDVTGGIITETTGALLGSYIRKKYEEKWLGLWETLNYDYNPIENYNRMHEEIMDDEENQKIIITDGTLKTTESGKEIEKISGKEKETFAGSEKEVKEESGKEKETHGGSESSEEKVSAYNSENYEPASKEVTTHDTSNEIEYINRKTENEKTYTDRINEREYEDRENSKEFEDRETVGKNNETITEKEKRKLIITDKGNIGVTTTQQMIQQEREVLMYDFYDQIFEDIDRILTLSVWE